MGLARAGPRRALRPHRAVEEQPLERWLSFTDESFRGALEGSPLQRARRAGLARNAAIALGRRGDRDATPALLHALSFDPEPMVRDAAAWALARAHGAEPGVRGAIEQAWAREPDPGAREQLRRTLDGEA